MGSGYNMYMNSFDPTEFLSIRAGGKWTHYQTREPYTQHEDEGGATIVGLRGDFFSTEINDEEYSAGVFMWNGMPSFIAWGKKSAPHCNAYAVFKDGAPADTILGCPVVAAHKNTPGFTMTLPDDTIVSFR